MKTKILYDVKLMPHEGNDEIQLLIDKVPIAHAVCLVLQTAQTEVDKKVNKPYGYDKLTVNDIFFCTEIGTNAVIALVDWGVSNVWFTFRVEPVELVQEDVLS